MKTDALTLTKQWIDLLARWEDKNGTLAGITEPEYAELVQSMAALSIHNSPRMARNTLRATQTEGVESWMAAHVRDHKYNSWCDGCKQIQRLLSPAASAAPNNAAAQAGRSEGSNVATSTPSSTASPSQEGRAVGPDAAAPIAAYPTRWLKIKQLSTLGPNWNSYGCEAFSKESVEAALALEPLIPEEFSSIVPIAGGGVQFGKNGDEVTIEVYAAPVERQECPVCKQINPTECPLGRAHDDCILPGERQEGRAIPKGEGERKK